MNSCRVTMLAASLTLGLATGALGQSALNLGFETRTVDPSVPDGWYVGGQGYTVDLDDKDPRAGKVSLRMKRSGVLPGFGVATASLPVKAARGKKARLSGEIETQDVKTGSAGLWLRVDGPGGKILGFDNMTARIKGDQTTNDDRGVRGTTPWKRYTIDVDPTATNINFGCLLSGDGTARFDDLSLELDGKPYDEVSKDLQASLAPRPEQLAWLRADAIPFETAEAGHGFDDLQALKKMIGDARIVALGEATHGTAEFFKMKHRLTEFLASEMGFTIFAIEASMPEAYRVNDYVLRGEGDPKELLKGMYFWTWNTREVLDMILWMREFNKSGKGRIEFLGFDMQEPKVAAENVRTFAAKSDPEYAKELDAAYDGLKAHAQLQRELAPAWAREKGDENAAGKALEVRLEVGKLVGRLEAVRAHLEAGRERLVAAGVEPREVDWAIQNARVVVQAVSVLAGPPVYRDMCMADNVDWILKQHPPGTKIVLWAHNGHVAKRPGAMGGFLSKRHGPEMVVAGFGFHEGRYTAIERGVGLKANDAGPSAPGSVEWVFHEAGLPRAILDLRKAVKDSPASGWLTEALEHRSIGALAMPSALATADLPSIYDLFIFFDQTTPSTLLPPHRRD